MATVQSNTAVIIDTGEQAVIKVIGCCSGGGAGNAYIQVVNPKTLRYANANTLCTVSVEKVEYNVSFDGKVKPYFEGTPNAVFAVFSQSGGGTLSAPIVNTANAATGNVGLLLEIPASPSQDTFTFLFHVRKDLGFDSRFDEYTGGAELAQRAGTLPIAGPLKVPTIFITQQPTDVTVDEGLDAVFTVVAGVTGSGDAWLLPSGAPLSYAWEYSEDGDSWTALGGDSDTLTITPVGTAYVTDYLFRVTISSDDADDLTSDVATLTIIPE